MVNLHAIGGYSEVGKNMTALEAGNDVILFDAGLYLPAIVGVQEREKVPTENGMRSLGALPDDLYLDKKNLRSKVRAIAVSHAHLDHVGGVQFLGHRYSKAQILGTPFTSEVLKSLISDNRGGIPNKIISVNPNSSYNVKGNEKYKIEFVNITHSTIQSAMIAVHTKDGIILYANDYKFDNTPVLGEKPNYKRLKELSKIGIKALVADCLYAPDDRKTPSEKIARGLLEDVLFTTENYKSGLIITTFSSHIARLKSITEFGLKLRRKVVFCGRSLNKYMSAAIKVGKAPFHKNVEMVKYRSQVERALRRADKNKRQYLVVCTGHQGEPGSILDRMSRNKLPYKIEPEDHVIFSSKTIPTPQNEASRAGLDKRLRRFHPRIFDNVHVSVLPDTEVVINSSKGMKIKEIGYITENEKEGIKVPAFDPSDLKIKWYDAKVIKHPYNGKIFTIHTKSGRSVSITSGHSLFKLEKGRVLAEKGDYLKIGDYLAIPKKFKWYKEINEVNVRDYIKTENNHYKFRKGKIYYDKIPITAEKIKLNNDFARLLGYYLAEGSAPRHISLVIGKHEHENLNEIKNAISKCFPSKIKVNERGNAVEITFGARILKNLFKNWFGDNAKTKRIPKFVFSSSNEFKLNFLGAYINGDGCIDKGKDHFRIRVKTASKKLASDLLYLMSQLGICAKFDHVEIGKRRKIAGHKKLTGKTQSYVIRIQGIEYLTMLKDFLSQKFRKQIAAKIKTTKFSQKLPPESLPIEKLDLDDIQPRKNTYLFDIVNYNEKSRKKHISQKLIESQAVSVKGFTDRILKGDLLFDQITGIKVSEYNGSVYDFSVPGPENFIGGFGGIILHNSGHGGREDLRDLIKLTNPEHFIPSHGDEAKTKAGLNLAVEMGYKKNYNAHLLFNGRKLKLK